MFFKGVWFYDFYMFPKINLYFCCCWKILYEISFSESLIDIVPLGFSNFIAVEFPLLFVCSVQESVGLLSEVSRLCSPYPLFIYLAAPRGLQDLGSPTRDWTWVMAVKAQNPNHEAARETLPPPLWMGFHLIPFFFPDTSSPFRPFLLQELWTHPLIEWGKLFQFQIDFLSSPLSTWDFLSISSGTWEYVRIWGFPGLSDPWFSPLFSLVQMLILLRSCSCWLFVPIHLPFGDQGGALSVCGTYHL